MTIQEIAVDKVCVRRRKTEKERYKLIQYYCRQQFIVKRDVFLMCTDRLDAHVFEFIR